MEPGKGRRIIFYMDHNEPVWCMLNLVYAAIVEQIGHVKIAVIFLFFGISFPMMFTLYSVQFWLAAHYSMIKISYSWLVDGGNLWEENFSCLLCSWCLHFSQMENSRFSFVFWGIHFFSRPFTFILLLQWRAASSLSFEY